MRAMINIESLRKLLDKFIDTYNLTDIEVLRIYETEVNKRHSFLNEIKRVM